MPKNDPAYSNAAMRKLTGAINMPDNRLVYLYYSNGGGIDGMDSSDKGGKLMKASFVPLTQATYGNLPWCSEKCKAVDIVAAKRKALNKLDAIDKLVLGVKE